MKALPVFKLLVWLYVLISVVPAKASHLLGADIFWNYIGSDTYVVSVTIYRDCNGIPMPAQPINIYPCGSQNGITVNTTKVSAGDITPVCKFSCSRCGSSTCSFAYGIEQYTFEAKVNFKSYNKNCCNFLITWEACCRNGAISTGAAGENYYVKASIDICLPKGDNSPIFKNPPVMICSVGQCLTFNYAAIDPDIDASGNLDSLVYLLDTPYQAAGQPVTYSTGYNFDHPLAYYGSNPNDAWYPSCKGFHLDPANGDLMFKATKEEITIVTILVQEWGRNEAGVAYKKGETRRDMTFFILYSNNKAPSLSGINGTDSSDVYMNAGQKKCFAINTMDSNTLDTVSITKILPASLSKVGFTIEKGVKHPSTIVCWQPDSINAGHSYQFVLKASDDACPVNGRVSRSYIIHVNPIPKATIKTDSLGCGGFQFKIVPPAGDSVYNLRWIGADGLSDTNAIVKHHYSKAGTYVYKVAFKHSNKKEDSLKGSIKVLSYLNVVLRPHDTLICLARNAVLDINTKVSLGKPPYRYKWGSGTSLLNDTGNALSVKVAGDTSFYVVVKDAIGCSNSDTVHIKTSKGVSPVKLIPPHDSTICAGEILSLLASASGGDSSKYMYSWNNGSNTGKRFVSVFVVPENIRLKVNDGCSADSDIVHIKIFPPLSVHTSPDTSVCLGQKTVLRAFGSGGDSTTYSFLWDNGLGTGSKKIVKPSSNTTYSVKLSDACENQESSSVTINVLALPKSYAFAIKTIVTSGQDLQFENQSVGAVSYFWNFGDGATSTYSDPSHTYKDTGTYSISLISMDMEGCTDTFVRKGYIHVIFPYQLYLPTGFSPNADGLNDCFMPIGLAIKDFDLQIFSRIGSIVYTGKSCWDGTFHNVPAPEGMYMYSVTVTTLQGDVYNYWGHFYLVR